MLEDIFEIRYHRARGIEIMNSKSVYVRARIEPGLKAKAEAVFNELGISPSEAIGMLYEQVSREHRIPLELSVHNKRTIREIQEAREGRGLVVCKDVSDLFHQL